MKGNRTIPGSVLVVDDDESIREGCAGILAEAGYRVDKAVDVKEGLAYIAESSYDVILLDLRLPDIGGVEALSRIRAEDGDAVIVIITGFPTIASVVETIKKGAFDYIPKPFAPEQLLFHVERALRKRLEEDRADGLRRRLMWKEQRISIIARSKAMKKVMRLAEKVAASESTVLITGESGTGKEVMARHIHALSSRKGSEFVAVDCSALVEGLIESELFGHVKGAFTGAWKTARGSLELADGGTFFFDEVSNLSMSVQSKVLRTIQEKEVRRIGDPRPISVDVRILAATNRDLGGEVEGGRFREDLYYRLNVFPLRMPPLRERTDDILPLANEFLGQLAARKRKDLTGFSDEAARFLRFYDWPGNVRELRNTVERAVLVEEGEKITLSSMLIEPSVRTPAKQPGGGVGVAGKDRRTDKPAEEPVALKDVEARHIRRILERTAWNKGKAARLLGIDKKTLASKIKRYGLEK